MINLLTAGPDKLQIITGGTQAISVHVSWVDLVTTTTTPGRLNTAISSAATTAIADSTGLTAGTTRNVKTVSIRNKDASASDTVTVQHTDGTTVIDLIKVTLLAGYSLQYDEGQGWAIRDASGGLVQTPLAGRFLKSTVILNGTTSFTTGAATNTIKARMQGGGGQGGGAPATTGENGSGGGSGSYAEKTFAVTPNTTYTVAVGAGGSTGGNGATGQTGGITTLAVGATTVTCNGGIGGVASASISVPVKGGLGGAVSTNGDVNCPGEAGGNNVSTGTALNNAAGPGANSQFGAGGLGGLNADNANGNAAAAGSFGAGGAGATTTGTTHAGGAGANGIIIVDEYS